MEIPFYIFGIVGGKPQRNPYVCMYEQLEEQYVFIISFKLPFIPHMTHHNLPNEINKIYQMSRRTSIKSQHIAKIGYHPPNNCNCQGLCIAIHII